MKKQKIQWKYIEVNENYLTLFSLIGFTQEPTFEKNGFWILTTKNTIQTVKNIHNFSVYLIFMELQKYKKIKYTANETK